MNWKDVVSTIAPVLGTALGGPLGGLAGGVLAKALGKDGVPATQKEIEAAVLGQDTEVLLKIKAAENEFREHMRQMDIDEEALAYKDVDSARAMNATVKDNTPRNLAYLVVGGTAVAIGATLMGYTHVDSALAGTLIGYLVAEARSVFGFYFGSSKGSQDKDATIASATVDLGKSAPVK